MAARTRAIRGYIELATNLYKSKKLNGNSFNFGPKQNFKFKKVIDVIKIIKLFWPSFNWKYKINKKLLVQVIKFKLQ